MASFLPLKNKVICITGAAQGIGQGIARYVAARGAHLSLADISDAKLKATARGLSEAAAPGSRVFARQLDVADPIAVEKWVADTKSEFGRIDGCVNNAGIFGSEPAPLTDTSFEDWSRTIAVNLTGTFNCLKHQLRAAEDGASIVNMSSAAGLHGAPIFAAYSASKHGIIGLTRCAALQSAARRIRVNAVCPSYVDTPMFADSVEATGGGLQIEGVNQMFPRLATPDDVAGLVGYLLGDESKFVTDSVYRVDGGFKSF
ncbi:hypothetical protein F5X96DRAFT_618486 [Biscogniauxia mediterranea]|nr:hypothetical protein F5X96DRAFT_618486 [Biscogniauxia mediterranea]